MDLDDLLRLLLHNDPRRVEVAVRHLAAYRRAALPRLEYWLRANLNRVTRALYALEALDAHENVGAMLDAMQQGPPWRRQKMLRSISRLCRGMGDDTPAAWREMLLDQWSPTDWTTWVLVADVLQSMGRRWAVKALLDRAGAVSFHQRTAVNRVAVMVAQWPDREVEALLAPYESLWKTILETNEGAVPRLAACVRSMQAQRINSELLRSFGKVIAGAAPGHQPVLRDEVVRGVVERLQRSSGRRHVLMVGPPGVGKTAILHAAYAQIQSTVVETSTTLIMAGTRYLGEWQTRVRDLVEATRRPRDVVLYFTDINVVESVGRSSSSTDTMADALRGFMEAGDITVVGETTAASLATGLARNPSFLALFTRIEVAEPGPAEARAMVRAWLESHTWYKMGDDVLDYLFDMAANYNSSEALPGRAVRIIEQMPRLEHEQVRVADIIAALAARTSLPSWLMDDSQPLDADLIRRFFSERIMGQDEATSAMVDRITLIKAGLVDPTKPQGVFLFVGPTGVGKTEIAKALAEFLFGSADRLVRIDMSEFKDWDGFQRLIGAKSWKAEMEEGVLTHKVKSQPFSVVLLDEFEKAHPNIYYLMLQVFDDGRLTTGLGETVSFRQTIIIMTSNLGAASGGTPLGFIERSTEVESKDIIRKVREGATPKRCSHSLRSHIEIPNPVTMRA